MSALQSPAPRPDWKLPGWGTFWGSHVPESSLPPVLAAAVFVFTLAGLLYALMAGPFEVSAPPALRGHLQLVLPWIRALCALLVAAFAWGAWLTRGSSLALLLAGILPVVGLLDAGNGFALWQSQTPLPPGGGGDARISWVSAWLVLAAGIQLAWAGPWLARVAGASRLRRWAVPLVLSSGAAALAFLAMAFGLGRTASSSLAANGLILALLVAAVPAVARLHRRDPDLLSHAALLSLAPQAGAHLASLASLEVFDTAAFVAQVMTVLTFFTLFKGVIFDFVTAQRDRTRMQGELQQAERGLERANRELQRTNAELLRELRRVERMKQEFLATVSHELRTPLTSMLGAIGLVRSTRLEVGPDKAQELLEITERNGARLLCLINDLLDLQRLEAGELLFHLTEVDVGAVFADAVHGIQGFADLCQIRVRTESSANAGLVTDRGRLAQVLGNLLSNAIKFSPSGEEVLLAARAMDGHVELTVRDRGPGIPEEFRGRLFEKFAQADASHARRQGGSGLGLSISKKLVEGLGGTIDVASSPQAGTTVTVRLPLGTAVRPISAV